MDFSALNAARAQVASARELIAQDDAAVGVVEDQIATLQAQINRLRERQQAQHRHENLALAERALAEAEEAAVTQINLELANEIMKRQAADPLRHHAWIAQHVTQLHASMRSEMDMPINERYAQHPLITQALALIPPKDGIDRPVWDLGYQLAGQTDWPSRRRRVIDRAEAELNPPLEAA